MGVYLPNSSLPSAYQEVEYIQSSGTQYIDTGYKGNQDTAFEVKVRMTGTNTQNQQRPGGDMGSDTSKSITIVFATGSNSVNNRFGGTVAGLPSSDTSVGTDYVVHTDKSAYTLNGTTKTRTGTVGTFTTENNMWLLQVKNKNNTEGFIGRMYYAKIWDNGTLTRDFIPCYRKSDNVIGLYDLVNSQFYTNSGTGTFSKGEDVATVSLKNAYIGEYRGEYVYDFTTKTIADLTTDGWTNIDSNLAIDSNGIYNTGSGQKGPNYILNASPSELFTFKYYFMSTTVGSRTGTTTQYEGGASGMGGTYYGLMTNSGYKLRWSGQYGSTSASNGITRSANTWYIGTHTVDLVNNTLTVTVATENAPNTILVTLNKDISSIIGNITPMDRIGIRLERNYVRCKRVEVTRS